MKRWAIPQKRKALLRSYASVLFYSDEWALSSKRYIFYVLLRPVLDWVKDSLVSAGLEPEEAESEIFLLSARLFKDYDPHQWSIVPYLERHVPWKVSSLLQKVEPPPEVPVGLLKQEGSYEMEFEPGLSVPGFIFEDKWLARNLSQRDKHLILKILTVDEPRVRNLSDACKVSKSTVANNLQNVADNMKGRF